MPRTPLHLFEIPVSAQRSLLVDDALDIAIVRLPIERTGLHVIPLYDEVTVVVMGVDSTLTVADDLVMADLAGEVVLVPQDDVLHLDVPDTRPPAWGGPDDTAAAIELAATEAGVVIVPMSLARRHHRRDVTYRPLTDAPTSAIGLAWVAERTTAEIETFVGIVRGRGANSSRS